MSVSSAVSLFLALGLLHPVVRSFSACPEDLEGSGDDLDGVDSGSGDRSPEDEAGELINIMDRFSGKDVTVFAANTAGGAKTAFHGSSVPTLDNAHGPANDNGSGFFNVANSKSFLERKDIFAAVIAGGVTGAILAALVAAIIIYTWQKKDDGGYSLGRQKASDEDYHKPSREDVV